MVQRFFALLIVLLIFSSCNTEPKEYGDVEVNINQIEKDVSKWYQYHYYYLDLNEDYKALDQDSKSISKQIFLEKLTSGKFLAARLHSVEGTTYYKLFQLGKESDPNIGKTLSNLAKTSLNHYRFEGKKFPDFQFKDLKGNIYNNANTLGKVLVFKTWFINCAPCIKEMPANNYLKKKYSEEDALFIGLTFDKKEDLMAFTEKTTFNYNIVPVDSKFIHDTIGINQYPTHIIVDRQGRITKLMNDTNSLRDELEKVFKR